MPQDARFHGVFPLGNIECTRSPSGSLQRRVFYLHNKLAPCYKSALLMILLCLYHVWFCFLDHLSPAHGSTASSTASQTQTLWLFTQGTLNCILSFYPWHVLFFFSWRIFWFFFRALSQDDQDDIHLKLEDIIQLVSSAMVLPSTVMCKLPLKGKQRAGDW